MTTNDAEPPLTEEQSDVLWALTRDKAKGGHGLTVGEIAAKVSVPVDRVRKGLAVLRRRGQAHAYGVGGERSAPCWHPDPEPVAEPDAPGGASP